MNASFIEKLIEYICSIRQETETKFLLILGTMYKFSKNMNLFPKNNLASPTARAEMTSPVPTLSVISLSSSCLKELVSCKEEQTWLVAPESSIQAFWSFSTKHVSKTSKSYLPSFSFFLTRYLGQFVFQCSSTLQ